MKLKYIPSYILSKLCLSGNKNTKFDMCFVMDSQGWILESISKNTAAHLTGFRNELCYTPKDLPDSEWYFFTHFAYLKTALIHNPSLWNKKIITFFTHPREDLGINSAELDLILKKSKIIVTLNSPLKDYLKEKGVKEDKIYVIPFGFDPKLFPSRERTNTGAIGFSMAYYDRKNPELVKEITMNTNRDVYLFGKGWDRFPGFNEMKNKSNFFYSEPTYEELPECYRKLDVLISTSFLEGGPTPIIEALVSGVPVVASNTGFATDLIQPGKNGFIFETTDELSNIMRLIDRATELTGDISGTVGHCAWENCAQKLKKAISEKGGATCFKK